MGAKSSKTEVFYTFWSYDPKDQIEKLAKKKMKGAHIVLKPLSPGGQASSIGPTLIFRECFDPSQLGEFLHESRLLRANELMVVLTSEVKPLDTTSTALVQLLCKLKSKSKSIDMSEANKKSILVIEEFLNHGGRVVDTPEVHMAYGDNPELLLRDAVSFLEKACQLRLVVSPDLQASRPLLVFCKNDTKLQEDIRHAMENTRGGMDVMLLIVTDRKELVLTDTDATQNFGAKGCLLFNQFEQRFRLSENEQTVKWISKFLERYQIEVSTKLQRGFSLRRPSTWRSFRKSEGMGSYLVLGDLSEEQLKHIVLFFDDRKVGLSESEHGHNVSPLVILCAASQHPEQRLATVQKSRQDLRDVYVVIIHKSSEEVPAFRTFQDVPNGKLATEDYYANVLDNAQNRRLVEGVRKFLRKYTAPSGRRQIVRVDQLFGQPESGEGAGSGALRSSVDRGPPEREDQAAEDGKCDVSSDAGDRSRGEPSPPVLPSASTQAFYVQEGRPLPPPRTHLSETDTRRAPVQESVPDTFFAAQDRPSLSPVHTAERHTARRGQLPPPIPQHHISPGPPLQTSSTARPAQPPPPHHLNHGQPLQASSGTLPPHYHHHHHYSRQPSTHSSTFSQVPESSSGDAWSVLAPSSSLRIAGGGVTGAHAAEARPDGATLAAVGRDSYAMRRRHQRPALRQVDLAGTGTPSILPERSRAERGPAKRRVKERFGEDGGHDDLLHLFEDLSINTPKRKKLDPEGEKRQTEGAHALEEDWWIGTARDRAAQHGTDAWLAMDVT